jgi:hypothetical protein
VSRTLLLIEFFLQFLDLTPQLLVLQCVPIDLELGRVQVAALFVVPLGQLLDLALSQKQFALELVLLLFQTGALPSVLGPHLLQLAELLSKSFEHGVFFLHVACLSVHESAQVHLLFFLLMSPLILFVSQLLQSALSIPLALLCLLDLHPNLIIQVLVLL